MANLAAHQDQVERVLGGKGSTLPETLRVESERIVEGEPPSTPVQAEGPVDPAPGLNQAPLKKSADAGAGKTASPAFPRAVSSLERSGRIPADSRARRILRTFGRFTGLSTLWTFFHYGLAVQRYADELLDPSKPVEVRAKAARQLGELRRAETIEVLGAAAGDPDPRLRQAAAAALLKVGEKWAPVLIRELQMHPFAGRRIAAARGLGIIAHYGSDTAVIEALAYEGSMDISEAVRISAIEALAAAKNPKALTNLYEMLRRAQSPKMRSALEFAVYQSERLQSSSGIQAALYHPPAGEFEDAKQPLHAAALKRAVVVALAAVVIEFVGGLVTGSVSLKSDAMHLAADAALNVVSLLALWASRIPPTSRRTYGHLRAGPIVGFVSALGILYMAGHMLVEAIGRLSAPAALFGPAAALLALAGLASNAVSAVLLYRYRHENVNLKGAFLHAAIDALGSAAVIVGGLLISLFGWVLADPIISILIFFLILHATRDLFKESWNVSTDAVPSDLDLEALEGDLLKIPGVLKVHDIHARSLNSRQKEMTAVLFAGPGRDPQAVLKAAKTLVTGKYKVGHSTIEVQVLEGGSGLLP